MHGQNEQHGMWMYQCIHCKKNFPSIQAIAGHTKGHLRDDWILVKLRARLTREEQEVILPLFDSAMEQVKQSSKNSTEAEVIPYSNSEATLTIGTTDIDTDISTEESDDESKNM
ncbi:hypothetical protein R3W88_001204 [Solanum pinnatisectum]|uniref:C2H2-type domain-containing protein n=1 Tax=Solanum pinnatisectum TaxID=50273 RepID=A0AAV9MJL7_9SOLN|nr:hypothetical protein R3W88_001204 [Solanum pinnatisectum]